MTKKFNAFMIVLSAGIFLSISKTTVASGSSNLGIVTINHKKYSSLKSALKSAKAGDTLILQSGKTYNGEVLLNKLHGKDKKTITITTDKKGKAILTCAKPSKNDAVLLEISNSSNILINNLWLKNYKVSNAKIDVFGIRIKGKCNNITVKNCKLSNIGHSYQNKNYKNSKNSQGHGILVINSNCKNDSSASRNIKILNNELCNLQLGNSESLTINGNVKNVYVNYNKIHDNDNIGIDFAGSEFAGNSFDKARYCQCIGNKVYNIKSAKNPAYNEPAADGIYVDGGKDITIANNEVTNCDIGIEAASEHKGKFAENIFIYNNLVSKCQGYTGLSLGGCDQSENGSLKNAIIHNNTLLKNGNWKQDGCYTDIVSQYIKSEHLNSIHLLNNKIDSNGYYAENKKLKLTIKDSKKCGYNKNTIYKCNFSKCSCHSLKICKKK